MNNGVQQAMLFALKHRARKSPRRVNMRVDGYRVHFRYQSWPNWRNPGNMEHEWECFVSPHCVVSGAPTLGESLDESLSLIRVSKKIYAEDRMRPLRQRRKGW